MLLVSARGSTSPMQSPEVPFVAVDPQKGGKCMGYVSRWFAPMPAGSKLIDSEEWKCPVCKKKFEEGDVAGLQPVQMVKEGKRFGAVVTIPVHRHCYLQEEE